MNLEKVLIVGAGNGGHAAAVDLTTRGFSVCLYDFPEFFGKLGEKARTRTIRSTGFVERDVEIDKITNDASEAAHYSPVVLATMPAQGHNAFFNTFAERLEDNSRVYLLAGNLSSLSARRLFPTLVRKGITLVEFNSLPYGCRLQKDGSIEIAIRTKLLKYSTFPSKNIDQVHEEVDRLYPGHSKAKDILEVSLDNPNPLFHPTGTLLNIGRIEHSGGDFYMYNEGMTDSVMSCLREKEKERLAIADKLGYVLVRLDEFAGRFPDGTVKGFIECGRDAKMFGPCNRESRYLTEDVPFGIVRWSEAARLAGVPTPIIDAEIGIASTVCGQDFRRQGNCFTELKLNSLDDLKSYLVNGE